jgi:peptide subunit release factor RF-3
MKKYRSEIDEALHGDIIGLFEMGAISEAELKEFEADAFIEIASEAEDANEVTEEPISLSQSINQKL